MSSHPPQLVSRCFSRFKTFFLSFSASHLRQSAMELLLRIGGLVWRVITVLGFKLRTAYRLLFTQLNGLKLLPRIHSQSGQSSHSQTATPTHGSSPSLRDSSFTWTLSFSLSRKNEGAERSSLDLQMENSMLQKLHQSASEFPTSKPSKSKGRRRAANPELTASEGSVELPIAHD